MKSIKSWVFLIILSLNSFGVLACNNELTLVKNYELGIDSVFKAVTSTDAMQSNAIDKYYVAEEKMYQIMDRDFLVKFKDSICKSGGILYRISGKTGSTEFGAYELRFISSGKANEALEYVNRNKYISFFKPLKLATSYGLIIKGNSIFIIRYEAFVFM